MPKFSDKEIDVEGHDVKVVVKGSRAGELGPEIVDYLEKFNSDSQDTL